MKTPKEPLVEFFAALPAENTKAKVQHWIKSYKDFVPHERYDYALCPTAKEAEAFYWREFRAQSEKPIIWLIVDGIAQWPLTEEAANGEQ